MPWFDTLFWWGFGTMVVGGILRWMQPGMLSTLFILITNADPTERIGRILMRIGGALTVVSLIARIAYWVSDRLSSVSL